MLNLLASAIPGLRDLRAPLVAGYLWLLVAWLAIKPATPIADHATGVARSFVDLAHTVGPAATAAGVTVTAYVIGAISVSVPSLFRDAIASASGAQFQLTLKEIEWRVDRAERLTQETENLAELVSKVADNTPQQPSHIDTAPNQTYTDFHLLTSRRLTRIRRWLSRRLAALASRTPSRLGRIDFQLRPEDWRSLVGELAQAESTQPGQASAGTTIPADQIRLTLWRTARIVLDNGPTRPPDLQDVRDTLERRWDHLTAGELNDILARTDELTRQLRREVNLPNTLLVGDQPEIYAEADRARSEAEFRLALGLPTIALVTVLVVTGTPWWLFGFFAPAALFLTGLAKQEEARTFILNSIESGKTPSPAARRFSEYVTRRLAQPQDNLQGRPTHGSSTSAEKG